MNYYHYRESQEVADSIVHVDSINGNNLPSDADYQPLLTTSVTMAGALLVSLGGCSLGGMSLNLSVSMIETDRTGMAKDLTYTSVSSAAEYTAICRLVVLGNRLKVLCVVYTTSESIQHV